MKRIILNISISLIATTIISCASHNKKPDTNIYDYTIQNLNEVSNRDRWDVTDFSETVVVLLLTGNTKGLHRRLDPLWRKSIRTENLNMNFGVFVNSLEKAKRTILEHAKVLKFKLNPPEKYKVSFLESTNSESERNEVFYTVPGIKKQALVFFRIKHENEEKILILRLGYISDRYKLTGIALN